MKFGFTSWIKYISAFAISFLFFSQFFRVFAPELLSREIEPLNVEGFDFALPYHIVCAIIVTFVLLLFSSGTSNLIAFLIGKIWFVGEPLRNLYETIAADRGERSPSFLIRKKSGSASFNETVKFVQEYIDSLRAYHDSGGTDQQEIQSLHQCALTNVAVLARGVLNDFPPHGVNANIMHYEETNDRLIVLATTEFHSYDSIMKRWPLERRTIPDPEKHPGICIRALRTGVAKTLPDMTDEEKARGEPLKAMLSFPVANLESIRDGDLACINVNSFVDGYIPRRLKKSHLARIEKVRQLCTDLNEIRKRI